MLAAGRCAPRFVQEMEEAEQRMAQRHAWTRVAHDGLHPFPHRCAVAVHPAVIAGRFVLAEGTALQAPLRICEEHLAVFTQAFGRSVVVPAVDGDHGPDGALLADDTAFASPQRHRSFIGALTLP